MLNDTTEWDMWMEPGVCLPPVLQSESAFKFNVSSHIVKSYIFVVIGDMLQCVCICMFMFEFNALEGSLFVYVQLEMYNIG